ncbi:MAG: class I tRNA ligase family protein, partial [Bacteroidaceae bacterium]|nr:class I tRNA ligase family protein [Bacteroidaceae bacterium]
ANVDGWQNKEEQVPVQERDTLDRWILSTLNTLVKEVTEAFDAYEPTRAGRLIQSFVIDNFSNWYVRLAKKRLWGSELTKDKVACYQTMHTCLLTVAKLMAPISPFFAEQLYQDLQAVDAQQSIHLAKYPVADETVIDGQLETRMDLVQKVCSMVLSLRKKEMIGVRQPLSCIAIPVTDAAIREGIESLQYIILDEVNLKQVTFVEGQMVEKRVKPNFRVMGKKFGKQMKSAAAVVETMTQAQIAQLENGSVEIVVEGVPATLTREDVEIIAEDMPGWSVTSEGSLTVALDITITPELRLEGVARDTIRTIQTWRKNSGFEITDRIVVTLPDTEENRTMLASHAQNIAQQVLADNIVLGGEDVKVEKV